MTGNILKDSIKSIYFPLLTASIGSAFITSIFGMADAMMVGQYEGPTGVASLSIFSPMWNIIYCFAMLVGCGGSVLFANRRGAGKEKEAREFFSASLLFGIILSVLVFAILTLFHDPLFRFFGGDEELIVLANQYLRPIRFAVPCCIFCSIMANYLRNDNDANLTMLAVFLGGGYNVIADYIFIFVLKMGIFGAGLATATAQYVTLGVMLCHFLRKRNTLRVSSIINPPRRIWQIAKNGFSTAIGDVSMGVVTILFNRTIMQFLGMDALAVYGIIAQVVPLVHCCANGTGQAAQPILSQNLGAGQRDRVRVCMGYGIGTSCFFGILWFGMMLCIPNAFVYLFMKPTEGVLAIAPAILRTYGIAFLLTPFNIFATYYFQAILKPGLSSGVSFARGVLLSSILILLLPRVFGAAALWLAVPLTEVMMAVFCGFKMRQVDIE